MLYIIDLICHYKRELVDEDALREVETVERDRRLEKIERVE